MKRKTFIRIALIVFICSSILWMLFGKLFLLFICSISFAVLYDEYHNILKK